MLFLRTCAVQRTRPGERISAHSYHPYPASPALPHTSCCCTHRAKRHPLPSPAPPCRLASGAGAAAGGAEVHPSRDAPRSRVVFGRTRGPSSRPPPPSTRRSSGRGARAHAMTSRVRARPDTARSGGSNAVSCAAVGAGSGAGGFKAVGLNDEAQISMVNRIRAADAGGARTTRQPAGRQGGFLLVATAAVADVATRPRRRAPRSDRPRSNADRGTSSSCRGVGAPRTSRWAPRRGVGVGGGGAARAAASRRIGAGSGRTLAARGRRSDARDDSIGQRRRRRRALRRRGALAVGMLDRRREPT